MLKLGPELGSGSVVRTLGPPAPTPCLPLSALRPSSSWCRGCARASPATSHFPSWWGLKQPAAPYRDGQWTWGSFDAMPEAERASHDWSIALRDLCVVDVDSLALVEQLEATHSSLRLRRACARRGATTTTSSAPPRRTRWGYFDGSGQRIGALDFKSVTATG